MREITPYRLEGERFFVLDQTRLPQAEVYEEIRTAADLWDAIYQLKVRGAPAIGVAAALGVWRVVFSGKDTERDFPDFEALLRTFRETKTYLVSARPTAVNLAWALERMEKRLFALRPAEAAGSWRAEFTYIRMEMRREAEAIRQEDIEACRQIGEYGLSLLKPGMGLLTHCNAGTIATSRYGTSLAPIYLGQERGFDFHVFADETRPLLQGARLTAWELFQSGVDVTLICDNMAASAMRRGWIQACLVGCDRMAANGDGANKIGTSAVAILARAYGIPFYMFVPISTIDFSAASGADIRIEERSGEEIYRLWYERAMAPEGVKTWNPAFDVTDAKYITAVVTEKGIVYPPYTENLRKLVGK